MIFLKDSNKNDELIIKKNGLKGEDGYKVFSIRIREDIANRIDEIAKETNNSRNYILSQFIEYGLDKYKIE